MIKFDVLGEGKRYKAVFTDENGMSIIYRGSEKKCREYIKRQQQKILKGGLIHASKTVYEVV